MAYLPKPEKNKKPTSSQQLDLVDSLSSADKVKNKRRIVIIILIISVGLSLAFSVYRSVKYYLSQPSPISFNLKLPNLLPSHPVSSPNLDNQLLTIIENDPNFWSIYVQSPLKSTKPYIWSRNSDQLFNKQNLFQIIDTLAQKEISSQGPLISVLPQGAQIQETIETVDSSYYRHSVIITVPKSQILIIVKVSGSNELPISIQKIPALIKAIYWSLIQV